MGKDKKSWTDLSWDDLVRWARSRSTQRGRSKHRSGAVQGLALASGGRPVAWVIGGERYATVVTLLESGKGTGLRSRCSCPVGSSGCKHAVALVLAYLDALREKREVPAGPETDPRLRMAPGVTGAAGDGGTGARDPE